jgi:uncharacterized RDD family membrane protein YckC
MDANPYAAPTAPLDMAVQASSGAVRVGFWPRLGAGLLDTALTWIIGVIISGAVAATFPEYLAETMRHMQDKLDPKAAAAMPALMTWTTTMARWSMGAAVFGVTYQVLTEGLFGRSLGKLLLGLRIADVDAKKASVGRLLGRVALKQLSAVLMVAAILTNWQLLTKVAQVPAWLMFIGCFFVFAPHRRALHDLAAGTAVYRNTDVS